MIDYEVNKYTIHLNFEEVKAIRRMQRNLKHGYITKKEHAYIETPAFNSFISKVTAAVMDEIFKDSEETI